MDLRVVLWTELVETPWANGGGVTRQIARAPELGEFAWRLSAADVPVEAPFSILPGIERHLGVIAGGALALTVGESRRVIDVGDPAAVFDGGVPTIGAPMDAPVTDLNLMLRSGEATGGLEAVGAGRFTAPVGFVAIVSLGDGVTVSVTARDGDLAVSHELDAADILLGMTDAPAEVDVRSRGEAAGALAYLAYAKAR